MTFDKIFANTITIIVAAVDFYNLLSEIICSAFAFIAAIDVYNGSLAHLIPALGMQFAACLTAIEAYNIIKSR